MKSITRALKQLNWHHGRGRVTKIRLDPSGTTGILYREVPVTSHVSFTETRRFHLRGNSVCAFGHQMKR